MKEISISRGAEILAHHTPENSMSSYGLADWVILVSDPEPGPATWKQGDKQIEIEIVSVRDGWLIIRQPDKLLAGITWTPGTYFANILEDEAGQPCTKLVEGARVKGTVRLGELGAVL